MRVGDGATAFCAAFAMWAAAGCDRPETTAMAPASGVGSVAAKAAPSSPEAGAPTAAGAALSASSEPSEPRLAGPAIVDLEVEGFEPAVVVVPVGARGPRPVVVVGHGNYDRPEWQCSVWERLARGRAFVLCPRGQARPDSPSSSDVRFTYATNEMLEREILAGLEALADRFEPHVDARDMVLAGFSLGAAMGVAIAERNPRRFARLVLVEGGHDRWTHAAATRFHEGGGRRVLFGCGQAGCRLAAKRASSMLVSVGVETEIVGVDDAGHRYTGAVEEKVAEALDWLTDGDSRFSPAVTH